MQFRLHAFVPMSRANGPGRRAVVWFQGCTLGCPGCFNPETHDPAGGYAADTGELAAEILRLGGRIEGVSISGGEPLQQPDALLDLLQKLAGSGLSCLLFSGYSLSEIMNQARGGEVLQHVDVLIAGRYERAHHVGKGLLGSANQQVHCLSSRYRERDVTRTPAMELIADANGVICASGLRPWLRV